MAVRTVSPREFSVEEVLEFVTTEKVYRDFEGYVVKMNSLRYQVFLKGRVCASCGIEGSVFLLQQALDALPHRAHFNLYARDKDGLLVLMTKDHIKPRSKGGSHALSNLQPMCSPCNVAKGNSEEGSD